MAKAKKPTPAQIEKRIQRRLDTITAAQLVQLRKIFNSMKDGMSTPADWFEAEAPAALLYAPMEYFGKRRAIRFQHYPLYYLDLRSSNLTLAAAGSEAIGSFGT